jgi:hypothetical protein
MLQVVSSKVMPQKDENTFIERDIGPEQWEQISAAADKFFSHPVWEADLSKGSNARAVDDALKKNQNVEAAFKKIELTPGYCVGIHKLPTNWANA